ncbi:MAG: HK97 family phage prohead protease [Pseudomonadota bacterium]
MIAAALSGSAPARRDLLIEGYASRFGEADKSGDIIRPGAFAESLKRGGIPMLLQHVNGARVGRWVRMVEDGRGLFVRGLIESESAKKLAHAGIDGLSIGFRPRVWTPRREPGRLLVKVDLVEVSLVTEPMLPSARFEMV